MIEIHGHTDNHGGQYYNKLLSNKRAKAKDLGISIINEEEFLAKIN